jgi:diguanylate cyclase (GGDEF)-like protein/PAS domain S-box-containing protein
MQDDGSAQILTAGADGTGADHERAADGVTGGTHQRYGARGSVLVLAGALAAAAAFVVGISDLGGVTADWTIAAIGATLVLVASLQVTRDTTLPQGARRFWRQFAMAAAFTVAGLAIEAGRSLGWPHGTMAYLHTAVLLLYLAAAGAVTWGLLQLPSGSRTMIERVVGGLDVGIVLIPFGLFLWHFLVRGVLAATDRSGVMPLMIVCMVALLGSLTVVRICLTCEDPFDRLALKSLGGGVLAGLVADALARALAGAAGHGHHPGAGIAVTGAVWVWVLTHYARTAAGAGGRSSAVCRSPILLPGLATVATCGLLLLAGPESSAEGHLVVYTSVVVGLLVAARQALALHDNTRLHLGMEANRVSMDRYERRFRSLLAHATDIVLVTDAEGAVKYASPALQDVLGIPLERLLGHGLSARIHPDDRAQVARATAELRVHPETCRTYQIRARHADGSWRWVEVAARNLLHDPAVEGIVSNARDVTAARQYHDRLAYLASHDELTGLPKRGLLLTETARALATADDRCCIGLALIDINDFKTINDRLGHGIGDDVLLGVSNALVRCLGAETRIARIGGHQFAVLLDSSPAQMQRDIVRLLHDLDEPLTALGHDFLLQLNVGLADGSAGMRAEELMRRADVALTAAQDQGNGRHVTYSTELDRRVIEHARIGAELRTALKAGDQLGLLYQPIVTLPSGRIRSVEALVRWWHPEEGVMPPADFVPVAERNGLIIPLGRWVLRTACAQAAAWVSDPAVGVVTVSVNTSARELREPDFVRTVAAILQETGLDPAHLIIEVTETAVFDSERAMQALREVHALGIRIALDDFGTGHSSLGLLRTCPVDVIKVDKSFIDDVTGSPDKSAIAISLLQIARAMGLTAVAEGVETTEQADRLYEIGYEYAQGFLFGVPMPAEAIQHLLAGPAGDRVDRAPDRQTNGHRQTNADR